MEHRSFSLLALILTPLISVGSQGGVLVLPSPQALIDSHTVEPMAMEQGAETQYCSVNTLWQLAWKIADDPADSPLEVEKFLSVLATASPEDMKNGEILRILARFNGPFVERALEGIEFPEVPCMLGMLLYEVKSGNYERYLNLVNCYYTHMPEVFRLEELRFIGLVFLCARTKIDFNDIEKEVKWLKGQGCFEKVMCNPNMYGEKLKSPNYLSKYGGIWGDVFKVFHCSPFNMVLDNFKEGSTKCRRRVINYFLQQGVSPEICDQDGCSALDCAIDRRTTWDWNKDKVRRLILLFHKYAVRNACGVPLLLQHIYRSALMGDSAQSDNQRTVAAVALKMCHGLASVQVTDNEGNNPLHAAVVANDAYLAELIYSLNSELVSIPNKRGETPMALVHQLRAWKALGGMARVTDLTNKSSVLEEAIKEDNEERVAIILIEVSEVYNTKGSLEKDLRISALAQSKLNALKGMVAAAYFLERQRDERASLSYKMAMLKEQIAESLLPIRKLLYYFK